MLSFLLVLRVALTTVATLVPTFSLAAPTAAQKCEAAVETATAKFAQCRLNAEAKFTKDGDAAKRTASLGRCSSRLSSAFSKATAVYGAECPVTEPVGEFDAFLSQCSDQVESAAGGGQFPRCGDGAVNRAGEQCDGSDLGGETCSALGFVGGTLGCDGTCSFDTSTCATTTCAPGTVYEPAQGRCSPQWVVSLNPSAPEGYELRGATVDRWMIRQGLSPGRILPGVTGLDGRVYAVGGAAVSTTLEVYDPGTNSWTPRSPMPTAREGIAVAAANGKIFVLGGYVFDVEATSLALVEAYDPATDTWTTKSPMPTHRAYLGAAVLNGKIYAMGGLSYSGGSTELDTVEEYDPATDTWTSRAPLPTALWGFGAAATSDHVYAVRGGLNTFEYDPTTDSWTTKALLPEPAGAANTAVGLAGHVYSFGGQCTNSGRCAITSVFDPMSNVWSSGTDMPTGRNLLASAVAGERIYVVGGATDSGPSGAVEEYEPPAFLFGRQQ